MRLRPRSESSSSEAADRVLGLLRAPSTGWVPPPTAATAPDADADADATPDQLDITTVAEPTPEARPPLLAAVRHGRYDPGRRGAAALVVAALLAALVAGAVVLGGRPQEVVVPEVVATGAPLPGASAATTDAPTDAATEPATDVVVAVAGKVVRPGLVRLPAGSRVDDAVRAAGGVVEGADPGLLNLARKLVDGEQVLVGVDPPPGVGPLPGAAPAGPGSGSGPLDLNTATVLDLDALPGIGPVLAQRIVDWRTEHGRFASVEQLREVTGIGESKYADLAAEVVVP